MPKLYRVDAEDFIMQRLKAALTREQAAALLRVSERTVRNWEQQRTAIPYAAYRLIGIEAGYDLPGDAWRGFQLRGDTIWSPEGKAFSAFDLAWWSLTCALARERLAQGPFPQAAANQPVPEAMAQPPRAADRREASPKLGRAEGPLLQNRSLHDHRSGIQGPRSVASPRAVTRGESHPPTSNAINDLQRKVV
jgi:transcriptional regulator with XRE-family HTH domain